MTQPDGNRNYPKPPYAPWTSPSAPQTAPKLPPDEILKKVRALYQAIQVIDAEIQKLHESREMAATELDLILRVKS